MSPSSVRSGSSSSAGVVGHGARPYHSACNRAERGGLEVRRSSSAAGSGTPRWPRSRCDRRAPASRRRDPARAPARASAGRPGPSSTTGTPTRSPFDGPSRASRWLRTTAACSIGRSATYIQPRAPAGPLNDGTDRHCGSSGHPGASCRARAGRRAASPTSSAPGGRGCRRARACAAAHARAGRRSRTRAPGRSGSGCGSRRHGTRTGRDRRRRPRGGAAVSALSRVSIRKLERPKGRSVLQDTYLNCSSCASRVVTCSRSRARSTPWQRAHVRERSVRDVSRRRPSRRARRGRHVDEPDLARSARDRPRDSPRRTARGTPAGTRGAPSRDPALSDELRRVLDHDQPARLHDAQHLAHDVAARVARQLVEQVDAGHDVERRRRPTAAPRRSRPRASARRRRRAACARSCDVRRRQIDAVQPQRRMRARELVQRAPGAARDVEQLDVRRVAGARARTRVTGGMIWRRMTSAVPRNSSSTPSS